MAARLRKDDNGGSAAGLEGYPRVQGMKICKKAFLFLF